jgi:two-component system, NarL family, nitrate/nitrite response regulator NarL
MKKTIRLLLVDDHPVVRKGIRSCLTKQSSIEIVDEAADGEAALGKMRQLKPDVVLMDIDMPRMTGLAVTEAARKELPDVKVLILSMHADSEHVLRILQSGARGYVLKEAPPEDLVKAIETVYAGQTFFSPEVAKLALNGLVQGSGQAPENQLTDREEQVLIQIAEGFSNKEIACRLDLGVRTVETHRERIMRKLDIHSVAGLTKYAISKGLVALRTGPPN